MAKKRAMPMTASGGMISERDRWEDEGGAQGSSSDFSHGASDLTDIERNVLECLGAAVVREWNNLPTDIQRALFQCATTDKSSDRIQLKSQIARFLHNHKDAAGASRDHP